jgi:DNA-binding NarL/FixJ family response regulator
MTTSDTLRVVVADDQALVRVGFCGIIAATPGFAVVGEAGNGVEAVEAARRARPDVILMDVRMPVMDGIEATRQITQGTDVRALILTTFDLDEYVFAALRAGASGFLLKDTLPADLLTAIRVVAAGDALLAPSVTRRLIGEFARTTPSAPTTPARGGAAGQGAGGGSVRDGSVRDGSTRDGSARDDPVADATARTAGTSRPGATFDQLARVLTDRELEVLTMVARGLANAEIAEQLTISPATAKTHVAHLLTKLDARDRIQLVIIAYQSGLVENDNRSRLEGAPYIRAQQPGCSAGSSRASGRSGPGSTRRPCRSRRTRCRASRSGTATSRSRRRVPPWRRPGPGTAATSCTR